MAVSPISATIRGRHLEILPHLPWLLRKQKRSQNPALFLPGTPIMSGPSTQRKSCVGVGGPSRYWWLLTISPGRSYVWLPWKAPTLDGSLRPRSGASRNTGRRSTFVKGQSGLGLQMNRLIPSFVLGYRVVEPIRDIADSAEDETASRYNRKLWMDG